MSRLNHPLTRCRSKGKRRICPNYWNLVRVEKQIFSICPPEPKLKGLAMRQANLEITSNAQVDAGQKLPWVVDFSKTICLLPFFLIILNDSKNLTCTSIRICGIYF
jgi:hypothetical protein